MGSDLAVEVQGQVLPGTWKGPLAHRSHLLGSKKSQPPVRAAAHMARYLDGQTFGGHQHRAGIAEQHLRPRVEEHVRFLFDYIQFVLSLM